MTTEHVSDRQSVQLLERTFQLGPCLQVGHDDACTLPNEPFRYVDTTAMQAEPHDKDILFL